MNDTQARGYRIMEKRSWFVRLIVPWALLPVTWQGFLFEIVMIVIGVNLGRIAGHHLEAGDVFWGNTFIILTVLDVLIFVGFGIYKSRPLNRRQR
ncbi:hypothetical protein [Caulobacter sp. AP07]|uniref:hypothetical protein n=1 Tax=Caulobacter sp. AP07 TaxID=1144304 RepID=UPI0012F72EEB|nr:hypothetical protein [Caulobacter sp. AP07]